MLREWVKKVKERALERRSDLFVATIIFLTGLGSFGLGRLSAIMPDKPPLTISPDSESRIPNQGQAREDTASAASAAQVAGKYVGSKSGSAYHLPWCPGALRIKEQNKIWFQTKTEAEQKGYKPAGNCPGL